MASIQSRDEIWTILASLEGEEFAVLQVLGINSLKSVSPMPDALTGETIESITVDGRRFTLTTARHQIVFDLERTGKVLWLRSAQPYVMTSVSSQPTVRLVLANGQGFDLTEPTRTKRISVTVYTRA